MKHPKAKGRRLELKVAKLLNERGFDCRRMPLSGIAPGFKGDIQCNNLNYYWEVRNREKVELWKWWREIESYKNPLLLISGNRKPILAIMDVSLFLDLLKK